MSFGFGEAICPDCYQGEHTFLFFDESYLLNRIITRLQNHERTGHTRADRVFPPSGKHHLMTAKK